MKRGRSTGKPTKAEAARIVAAKEGPCVACMVWHELGHISLDDVVFGCDYNHTKSGNIRRGHMHGFALCAWHHRRHPIDWYTIKGTAQKYGPSLMDGSALFHETYGTDDELIALQNQLLEAAVKLQTVTFTSGHRLVDNGVGDYDLCCPVHGNMGFSHMGEVAAIQLPKSACGFCRQLFGDIADGSPKPYEVSP